MIRVHPGAIRKLHLHERSRKTHRTRGRDPVGYYQSELHLYTCRRKAVFSYVMHLFIYVKYYKCEGVVGSFRCRWLWIRFTFISSLRFSIQHTSL